MWPPEAQPILRWRGRELESERQEERKKQARRVLVRASAPLAADLYLADSLKEQQQQNTVTAATTQNKEDELYLCFEQLYIH